MRKKAANCDSRELARKAKHITGFYVYTSKRKMSSQTKIKKDKEIIAEYETQVKEIRNQLVEQFKCLEQQSEARIQLLQDLQEFFRRKAEIQLEYSRSLEKLAERFSSKIRGPRKEQHLLSSVNCWYLVLNQTRRESRDHATLNDIYINNVIVRLAQISEDVIRLFKKSKEIGIQMHEELVKVTNELYTVSIMSLNLSLYLSSSGFFWLCV